MFGDQETFKSEKCVAKKILQSPSRQLVDRSKPISKLDQKDSRQEKKGFLIAIYIHIVGIDQSQCQNDSKPLHNLIMDL